MEKAIKFEEIHANGAGIDTGSGEIIVSRGGGDEIIA